MALEPRQAVDVAGHGDALTIGKIVAVAAQAGDGGVAVLAIGAGIGVEAVDDPGQFIEGAAEALAVLLCEFRPLRSGHAAEDTAAEGGDADDA